jgi:uncharacterized membrane protein
MRIFAVLQFLSAKQRLVALYALCAVPLGMFFAMATPLGQVPDEPAHMARAEGLLHGAILAVRKSAATTGVEVDAGLFQVAFGKVTEINGHSVETLADYDTLRNQPASHLPIFASIPNTGTYFPAAYLPATFGLALGLALKLSPFNTMVLARLCMLAASLLLSGLALTIASYGEALLLCILLMPMTLSLMGSLNQDGVLIGMACLSAAAMTRDFSHGKFRWLGLLPLVLILGSKPPYLPLLGLALLPLSTRGILQRARDMVLAAAPVLVWVALVSALVVVPFGNPPYHPGPLFAGNHNITLQQTDAHANLHILLAQPIRFFSLPFQAVTGEPGIQLLHQMIGILGWLSLSFPARFYTAWTAALLIAALGLVFAARPERSSAPNALAQLLYVVLLLILSIWLIAISLYVTWTLVGHASVTGIQGRYFLVLLPFLIVAVPLWKGSWKIPAIAPALPAIALGFYDLGYVPLKIIAFYFMY